MISGRTLTLKQRLGIAGILLAAAPLLFVGLVVNRHLTGLNGEAEEELAAADLSKAVDSLYQRLEFFQHDVENSLVLAHGMLQSRGGLTESKRRHSTWQATSQATNQTVQGVLPRLYIGRRAISPAKNFRHAFVDEVAGLSGTTCTLFQRMNAEGDMLSVSTSAVSDDGARSIGSYMPAVDPDGTKNPIIQSVLGKRRFSGKAIILGRPFLTAFEGVQRADGEVIGMLYVGVPEDAESDTIRQALSAVDVGAHGEVFALRGNGTDLGRYLFSTHADRPSGLSEHAAGTIVAAAEQHPQTTVEQRYETAQRTPMVARVRYFAPWNWVIGAAVPASEYGYAASHVREQKIKIQAVLAWSFAIAFCGAAAIWLLSVGALISPFTALVKAMQEDARRLVNVVSQLGLVRQERRVGSVGQNKKIAEAVKNARLQAQEAERSLASLSDCDLQAKTATADLAAMRRAMAELVTANSKIGGTVKEIDGIARQSKILALNASIEAARAAGAGVSFAVVAEEFGKLATRFGDAARNTRELARESASVAAAGAEKLDKLESTVSLMALNSKTMKTAAEAAHTVSGKQTAALVNEIQSAIGELEIAPQRDAEANRSTMAGARVTAEAAGLQERSNEIADLVSGAKSGPRNSKTPRKQRPRAAAAKAPANSRSALREC